MNQRSKPKDAGEAEMRAAPRSQPATPTTAQAQGLYAADAAPRRASPTLSQLDRQDSYPQTPDAYERKRLPDAPTASGYEPGLAEQAGDELAIDDDYAAEIERLRHENAILKEQWSLTAMELNSFRSEKTYERDDSFFVSKFKTLRYKITDWAKRHFSDNIGPSRLSSRLTASLKDDMAQLAISDPFAEQFVYSPQVRFLIVEAFVWNFVVIKVMGDNGNIWAGRLKDSFGSMQRVLDPGAFKTSTDAEQRLYHMWRSCTVGIIQDRLRNEAKDQELSVIKLAADLAKKLSRYSLESAAVLEKGLREILGDVVGMDAEIGKQRAFYAVYMPEVRTRLAFNSTTMRSAPEDPREARDQIDLVGIVVRPMLVRRGTSSGQDYKQRASILIESEVLLYVNEPKRAGQTASRRTREQSRSREQQQGGLRKASTDVGRPRAEDGGGVVRRPVQANSASAESSDAGAGEANKATWYSPASHFQ